MPVRGLQFVVIWLILIFAALATPLRAAEPPIVYLQFNTDLHLETNGRLRVRMVQQLLFEDEFSSAFFEIPKRFVTGIEDVRVLAPVTPGGNLDMDSAELRQVNATLTDQGGSILVEWGYPRTEPGDIRLFVLEYNAVGTQWVYPNGDLLSWQAVNPDRSGVEVISSVVRLRLPETVPLDQVDYAAQGPAYTAGVVGQTLVFTATESLPDGVPFEVEATFPHGLTAAGVQEWQRAWDAESLEVGVDSFHADLTIRPDGTIQVHETAELQVLAGTLHEGFRRIDLLYVDDVTNLSVSQDGRPLSPSPGACTNCYLVTRAPRPDRWIYYDPDRDQTVIQEDNSGRVAARWYVEPLQAPHRTTIETGYELVGALRVNAENQLLVWPVVPDYGVPVPHATLRLELPPGIDPASVRLEGPPGQGPPQIQPDGSLLFRFDGPVPPGGWATALTLPAGSTTAVTPIWQTQLEVTMAEAEAASVASARALLFRRLVGLLALVGAALAALLIWYTHRRRVQEQLGGYLSEPPSRLSPALVAYLVEHKATEQGLLGAILHLASLGVLAVDPAGGYGIVRRRTESIDSGTTMPDAYGDPVPIDPHLAYLFNGIILPNTAQGKAVPLATLAEPLRVRLPELYALLGRDVQRFFIHVPAGLGVPWRLWGVLALVLAGTVLVGWLPSWLAAALGVPAATIAQAVAMRQRRRRYTDQGALEAERWLRFKNYLVDLKRYGDLAAAQEILDRYMGYAVALGVEDQVLEQVADLGGSSPPWMTAPDTGDGQPDATRPWPPRTRQPVRRRGTMGTVLARPQRQAAGARTRPTLAGMSRELGSALSRASADLGALLSTTAGDPDGSKRKVVLDSRLQRRELEWSPGTPVSRILDDILKQSMADARQVRAREEERRAARTVRSSGEPRGAARSSSQSASSSRSSGGFGRSSSSRSWSSSSRSSTSSRNSSSRSSRSGGGGRSGFR